VIKYSSSYRPRQRQNFWLLAEAGRIFSIHASPCGWLLCKDQVGESLRAGGVAMKTLLESAHGAAPFVCAALINPVLGQTEGQPAEAGQDHRRVVKQKIQVIQLQLSHPTLCHPIYQ